MVSLPPLGHGVAGVDHQVHDHLLDLARVGLDRAEARRGQERQLDVLADEPPEHLLDARPRCRSGSSGLRLQDLLPAEREELPGQVGRARSRAAGSPRGPRESDRRASSSSTNIEL